MFLTEEPTCVAPVGDHCGEGPVWHAAEQALYWTDINRFLIHRFNPSDRSVKSWFFDEPVTTIVLTDRDNTLAVALGSRVVLWNPLSDERREHGFRLNGWPAVRLNDGRADPRGSFWLGSMRNNVTSDGCSVKAEGTQGVLFRIDPDGAVSEWKTGIGVSNTLAWSPDHTRFCFADTLANKIWVYDYNKTTGAISGERILLEGFERGLPDGSAIDSQGYLWNCRFSGKCIVRVGPNGSINRVIEMPVTNITNCTFGDEDYSTLFITTASSGAPAGERLSGGLFALRTAIPGQPENRFRIFALG
jgi:sugar lactone lactonase YvrE